MYQTPLDCSPAPTKSKLTPKYLQFSPKAFFIFNPPSFAAEGVMHYFLVIAKFHGNFL